MIGKYKNKKGEDVDVTVDVYTRPNLRGYSHEMSLYVGRGFLDNIFDEKVINEKTTHVFFHYPETWANIVELQSLMELVFHFYPNIKKLSVTTHSVYIIQNTSSEHIRIMDDSSKFPQSLKPESFMSPKPDESNGLQVLGGGHE